LSACDEIFLFRGELLAKIVLLLEPAHLEGTN